MRAKRGLVVLDHTRASSAEAGAPSGYPAPYCTARGDIRASYGEGHSLWSIASVMAAGAELQWQPEHGDEVLYVLEGSLLANGKICVSRGSVIIEANVPANVRTLEQTRLIHFGPVDPTPPADGPFGPASEEQHGVRIVTSEQARRTRIEGPDGTIYVQHYYADGSSRTCRLALFSIDADGSADATLHHHTQDEIIHVLSGELHFGTLVARPGMAMAIQRNQRYGFKTTGAFRFLNYRRDASYVITAADAPPHLEVFPQSGSLAGKTGID